MGGLGPLEELRLGQVGLALLMACSADAGSFRNSVALSSERAGPDPSSQAGRVGTGSEALVPFPIRWFPNTPLRVFTGLW